MAARSFHDSGQLTCVRMWPRIMAIWSDHLTIKSGYDGGPEGRSRSDSVWNNDPGMTRDIREYQVCGTERDGFRIWVIIIQYQTVNSPMELLPINSKVVAETITRVLRSIGHRLVCLECVLWVEEAHSDTVRGETVK